MSLIFRPRWLAVAVKFFSMSSRTPGDSITLQAACTSVSPPFVASSFRHGAQFSSGMRMEPNRYSVPSVAKENTFGTNICGELTS